VILLDTSVLIASERRDRLGGLCNAERRSYRKRLLHRNTVGEGTRGDLDDE
jgi:hypothetical protein